MLTKDVTEKKQARRRATELSLGMGGNADRDIARGGGGAAGEGACSSSSGGNVPNKGLQLRDQYHAAFAIMRAAGKRNDITVVKEQRKIMARLDREIKENDGEPLSDNDEDSEVIEVESSDESYEGGGGGAGGGKDGASEDDSGYGGGCGGGGSAAAQSEEGAAPKKAQRQRESEGSPVLVSPPRRSKSAFSIPTPRRRLGRAQLLRCLISLLLRGCEYLSIS